MADYSLGIAELGTFVNLDGLKQGLDQAQGMAQQAGQGVAKGMGDGLNSLREIAVGALREVGSLITDAAMQGVQALGAFGAQSIDVAANFESGMNRLASVAGDSLQAAGFNLDMVRDKALELGAVTQFSAAQAQDAMINLAKGGVPIKDIMGTATDATLALAAAGELELGPAAEIVAKQLGVWSEQGVTATQVADLMAQAANASTVDVDELALGLANVGGVARESGVSFQDTVQTMALMSPAFSSAADAGTALTTFLINLQPKSNAAMDSMRDLGIITTNWGSIAEEIGVSFDGTAEGVNKVREAAAKYVEAGTGAQIGTEKWQKAWLAFMADFNQNNFYDANGSLKDMDQIAQVLQNSLQGLSEEEKQVALNTIFGSDAFRAAAVISKAGAQGFMDMGDAMKMAGSALDQAAQRNQGFKFAWDSLLGSIETVQIILGGAIMPILTDLVNNALIPAVNAVMEFSSALTTSSDPMGTLMATIDSIIPGFSTFVGWISTLIGALQPLWSFLSDNILPIVGGVATAIGWLLAPAIASAAGVALAAIGPFLAMIAPFVAVAAAAAALYIAWNNNFLGIRDIVTNVVNAILAVVMTVLGQIIAFWQANGTQIMATATAIWNQIYTVIATAIQLVIAVAGPILVALGALVVGIFTAIASFVQSNSATIQSILVGAWTYVSNIIQGVLALIGGLITAALQSINGNWSGAWQTLVNTAIAVWGNLRAAIGGAIQMVVGIITLALSPLVSFVVGIWNSITSAVSSAIGGLVATVSGAFNSVVGTVTAVWNNIRTAITNALSGVSQGVSTALSPVVSTVSTIFSAIGSAIGTAANAIVNVVSTAWNAVVNTTRTIWGGIVAVVAPVVQSIVSVIQTTLYVIVTINQAIWNTVVFLIKGALGLLIGIVGPPFMAMVSAISSALNSLVSFITSAWNTIVSATSSAWNAVVSAIGPPIQSAIATVTAAGQSILSALTSAWNSVTAATSSAWASITSAISSAGASVSATVSSIGASILASLSSAWNSVSAATSSAWASITSAVSSAGSALMGVVSSVASSVLAAVDSAWNAIMSVTSSVWASIQAVIESVVQAILGVVTAGWSSAQAETTSAMSGIQSLVASAWQLIQTIINTAVAVVVNVVQTAWAVIVAASQNNFNQIPQIIQAGWEKVKAIFQAGVAAVIGIWNGLVSQAASIGGSIIDGIARGISSGAGKLKDMASNAVKSALDAAKKALGIASPSKVMEDQVGAPIIDGILAGIAKRSPKLTQQVLDLTKNLVEVISKGAEAFAELNAMGNIPMTAVTRFADLLQSTLNYFGQMQQTWNKAMMSAASQFAKKSGEIIDTIAKGVDLLAKIANLPIITDAAVRNFAHGMESLMWALINVSTVQIRMSLSAAVEFSLGAGKVMEMVSKGVEALNALAKLGEPMPGMFLNFANQTSYLVFRMAEAARNIGTDTTAEAATFATGASKVLDVVSDGVDALGKLATLGQPLPGMFLNFATQVRILVYRMAEAAWLVGLDALNLAATFSKGAGEVLGVVSDGIDALSKLPDLAAPVPGMFLNFATQIRILVYRMAEAAQLLGAGAVSSAVTFTEGAGKVLDLVGKGVDALSKLTEFVAPAQDAAWKFVSALTNLLNQLRAGLLNFPAAMLSSLSGFSEGAQKAIAFVSASVDALSKIAELTVPADSAVSAFIKALADMLEKMEVYFSDYETDVLNALAGFGEGVTKAVAFVKNAVDGLKGLVTFVAPAEASTSAFIKALADLLEKMESYFGDYEQDVLAALAGFGAGVDKAVGFIKKAVEGLGTLSGFSAPAESYVDSFLETLGMVLRKLTVFSATFQKNIIAELAIFGEGIEKAVKFIKDAVGAFEKLVDFKAPAQAAMDAFQVALNDMLTKLIAVSQQFGADAVAAAGAWSDASLRLMTVVSQAVDGLGKLGEFKAPAQAAVSSFADATAFLVSELIRVSQQFTSQAMVAASQFATGVGNMLGVVDSSIKALDKLGTFKAPAATAIGEFGAALQEIVTTITTLAAQFAADALAAAGMFADGVGKLLTLVGQALEALKQIGTFKAIPATAMADFAAAVSNVISTLTTLAAQFQAAALTQAEAFTTAATAVVVKVKEGIDAISSLAAFKDQAGGVMTAFVTALRGILDEMTTQTIPAAQAYGTAFVQAMTTGVNSAMPGLLGAVQQGLAAIASLATPAKSAGEAVAEGIRQGFLAGSGNLLATIQQVAQQIIAAAQSALQIASPSKLAADLVGLPIAQGMAVGIAGHSKLVEDAATGAANSAFSAAGKVITESYSFTANYNRTQDERSLRDDIQMISMMRGRR